MKELKMTRMVGSYRSASLVGSAQEVVCEVTSDEAARCVADLKERRRRSIHNLSSPATVPSVVQPSEVPLPVAHDELKARRRRSVAAINRSAWHTPGPVEVDILPPRAHRPGTCTARSEPPQAPSPSRALSPPAVPDQLPTKQLELTPEQAAAVAAATSGSRS